MATDVAPGTIGGVPGAQRRAESAGSGAAAVRWLRPRPESDASLQHVSAPVHELELRWARQVEQRFQQLAVLFGERRVRSVPEAKWMDVSVVAAVEASASRAEARQRFFAGMEAVQAPQVEQIFATPPLQLGRGFADSAALGQQMRAASQRYYESVVGRDHWQSTGSEKPLLCDEIAPKRRVSQTSSEDGSEGENPSVPVAASIDGGRAQTTDGIAATRQVSLQLSSNADSRARTSEGIARHDVHGSHEEGNVVELREALRQARVHLRRSLPAEDGGILEVGTEKQETTVVGFATPRPAFLDADGSRHPRTVSPSWESCGPGTVLRSFPVQDVLSLGFESPAGSQSSSRNIDTEPHDSPSVGRRTRPSRSQYSRVLAAAAEEAELRLATAEQEAGRLEQTGDVSGARAAAAIVEVARQHAQEAQELCHEVEKAEAQLVLRAVVAEAVSLQDQLQSPQISGDDSNLQGITEPLDCVDAPLVLSGGRTLSMEVQKNGQGDQCTQIVLTKVSAGASSTAAHSLDGSPVRFRTNFASEHSVCLPSDSGEHRTETPALEPAQGVENRVLNVHAMADRASPGTTAVAQPQATALDNQNKSVTHAFGSKAHIDALLSALHTEETVDLSTPGSPGVTSAVARRQRIDAKLKRQQLVRTMLELAVAEQTKKERRKALLTMPGGRFLASDTAVSADPLPVESNPLKTQADLWARAQELIGERQKGQRVARALIESFEPVTKTSSIQLEVCTAATEVGKYGADTRATSSSATNNIAATEAWHSHGDGLEYAAVDIPETECATEVKPPDGQLVGTSADAECTQVLESKLGGQLMPNSDGKIARSTNSPNPQAVVETVARDKVLQKRAQVEVQEMLARIREKTKRQTAAGMMSTRSRDFASEDDSRQIHMQDSAVLNRAARPRAHQRHAGDAEVDVPLDYEDAGSARLAVQQKARGQVQEVLTKIKRQAKLHASPTRRSHSGHKQDISRTGVQEASRSGPDKGQNEACATGWLSATTSVEEVHTPVCKTRPSQHESLDVDDTRLESNVTTVPQVTPAEPRSIGPMEPQPDVSPVTLPPELNVISRDAARPAYRKLEDVDTMAHDEILAPGTETVTEFLQQPSAFSRVRAPGDTSSRQELPNESLVESQHATTISRSSKSDLRQGGLRIHTTSSDEHRSTETESAEETAAPTRRHSPSAFVTRSSPGSSSIVPASGGESAFQNRSRPLTPPASVVQQKAEIDHITLMASDQKLAAERVGVTCSGFSDHGCVAESLSQTAQETHRHVSEDSNACVEGMQQDFGPAGDTAELVGELTVCDISISVQKIGTEEQLLTTEAQKSLVETIAKAAHTDTSNVQLLGVHASGTETHRTDRSLTVRISQPLDQQPIADTRSSAVKTATHIQEAIADGSLTQTLKRCGVQSLSQAHHIGTDGEAEDSTSLTEEPTEQVRKASAMRRLTVDGIVVGVPIVGAIAKSSDNNEQVVADDGMDVNERVVADDMMSGSVLLTPPCYTERRKDTFLDSRDSPHAAPKQMLRHNVSAAVQSTMDLQAGETLSPGSPERKEFLKRRARAEMQNMLAQIEERQGSNSHNQRNSGGARRRLVNRPLEPLTDTPNFRVDPVREHNVDRNQTGTPMAFRANHSNGGDDILHAGASEFKEFDSTLQLPVELHSCEQLSSEPTTPKSTRDDACPESEQAPRTSTKDAVSAILAQLKSLNDGKVDLSSWTGDMRDLDRSGVDDEGEFSSHSDAEILQLSARSSTPACSNDHLQPTSKDSVADSNREATDIGETSQATQEATLLDVLSDGQICWRILRSVPWQQLRVFQRISTNFRTACKVVLALRPQVICVGGANRGRALRTAVAYDTASNEWSMLASMAVGRINSAVCGLAPGAGVLVAGGYNSKGIEASTERFDIDSGQWMITAPMPVEKSGCRGVLLQEAGIALVLGGYDQNHQTLARVDAYDWQEDKWNATQFPPMLTARYDCAACSLPRNRAVVAGGTDAGQSWLQSAEVYDHALRSWSFLPSLGVQRDRCAAVGLSLDPTGAATVLVLGGSSHPPNDETSASENAAEKRSSSPSAPGIVDLSTCEALSMPSEEPANDPANWLVAPQLQNPRCSFGAVAVGGTVLAIGGEASGTVERLGVTGRGGGWEEAAKLPHPRIGAGAAGCPMAPPPRD